MAQNLAEMGLAEDPNKAVPIPKKLVSVAVPGRGALLGLLLCGGLGGWVSPRTRSQAGEKQRG